ncbi:MAG: aminotransferase class I/II-fold pyridoxal phosphate-dependent enzyme, partial [Comamonas sp.]
MNPLLQKLQPYPFERLRQLFAGVTPPASLPPISLGIGEPRHPTPPFIQQALADDLAGLASYPATAGTPALRDAFAAWLKTRYSLVVDGQKHTLPVCGSREALFAFTQTVVDASKSEPVVLCPNPFY